MITQNSTTTDEVVYLSVDNTYIDRLSNYLTQQNQTKNSVTTPESHKQVILNPHKVNEIKTKFTRPYVCFEYSPDAPFLKCFPLGTFKKHDRRNDSRFFYIDDANGKTLGKVIVVKPLYIPTKYLHVINFKLEQNEAAKISPDLVRWLARLEKEFKLCQIDKLLICRQYSNIKFNRKVGPIDYSYIHDHYLIDEYKVHKFCELELKQVEEVSEPKQNC